MSAGFPERLLAAMERKPLGHGPRLSTTDYNAAALADRQWADVMAARMQGFYVESDWGIPSKGRRGAVSRSRAMALVRGRDNRTRRMKIHYGA